jgi:putative spermidine/putrescine transport system ATP-binding protein
MSNEIEVQLLNLHKKFGDVTALNNFSLEIGKGEMVALLGPSGCGKTTALRALAGLQPLDSGKIVVHGQDITNLPTNKRNMGMVFQSYSLFPHMSARDNVEYGLKMKLRKVSNDQRTKKSQELLELVGLHTHMNHYPHQLSGGQQQRVALARALAISPNVLLLDEPLSALDAKVRSNLRDEIRRIQLEVGTTTLFVTHDQEEALGIADRVGVMRNGSLEQIDKPTELYDRPATSFVAEFVGITNAIEGEVKNGTISVLGIQLPTLKGSIETGKALALVRPELVSIQNSENGNGRILTVAFLGSYVRIVVLMNDNSKITAQITNTDNVALSPGQRVNVTIKQSPVFAKAI